jgi:hypothetical protein
VLYDLDLNWWEFYDLSSLNYSPACEGNLTVWTSIKRVLDTSCNRIEFASESACPLLALLMLTASRAVSLDEGRRAGL